MGIFSNSKVKRVTSCQDSMLSIFITDRVVWVGSVSGPTWNFWYHICMDIDTTRGSMDTAINGKVVSNGVKLGEGVAEEMPRRLQGKLVVGKWNYTFTGKEEQFLWSVTNFQMFKGSELS